MSDSIRFEKMVALIHTLFEKKRTIIKWDDKVYGSSDPERERQVDVTVRRRDTLLHIECRKHKEPQDVTWIEQLIGRKVTLRPDLIIAVSSSGFTSGAVRTARDNGIILRDLVDLTDREMEAWGNRVLVYVGYLKYEMLQVTFVFEPEAASSVGTEQLVAVVQRGPVLGDLLKQCKQSLANDDLPIGKAMGYCFEFHPGHTKIDNWAVQRIFISANITYFRETALVGQVQVYGDVVKPKSKRNIYIQKMESSGIEIGRLGDNSYMIVDFSSVVPPDDAQFRDIVLDMGRPGRLTGFHLVGQKLPQVKLGNVRIDGVFMAPDEVIAQIIRQRPGLKVFGMEENPK